jgi:non-specific protein-tyrosine kinase
VLDLASPKLLAVALSRAGRRVILVDLDLRRPYLDRFFGLGDRPGLTEVVLGHVDLSTAITPVALTGPATAPPGRKNGNGAASLDGVLEVVPTGPLPPDPGEFVGLGALAEVLHRLRSRADVILVDSPPLLQVGDALTLSTRMDALVVVTRLTLVRRPLLAELRRALEKSPATKLGFVITGAQLEEGYGYGYGYGYGSYRQDTVSGSAATAQREPQGI